MGKVSLSNITFGISHLTEKIAKYWLELSSDVALFRNTTDSQSSFGMTDEREGLKFTHACREGLGGVGNVYNVFDTTPRTESPPGATAKYSSVSVVG